MYRSLDSYLTGYVLNTVGVEGLLACSTELLEVDLKRRQHLIRGTTRVAAVVIGQGLNGPVYYTLLVPWTHQTYALSQRRLQSLQ